MDFSSQFTKVLDELGKRFGIAIDWSQQNIMPYAADLADRIVKYEIVTSIIWIFVCVAIMSLLIFLTVRSHRKELDEDLIEILTGITGILGLVSIVILATQIGDITTACIIPEKIIIEMIQSYLP